MVTETGIRTERQWPVREILLGCYLLSLAGCGEGGAIVAGAIVGSADSDSNRSRQGHSQAAPDFEGDPGQIQVTAARLRGTRGGCEVDVTFTNVSGRTVSAGFRYDVLDAAGRPVTARETAVQQAAPGATTTVSSEGTTAGPSGVPCPAGGQARLAAVSVFNF